MLINKFDLMNVHFNSVFRQISNNPFITITHLNIIHFIIFITKLIEHTSLEAFRINFTRI